MNSYRRRQLKLISIWGYPMNDHKGAQKFPINFACRPCSSNMSSIQPHWGAFLSIWSWNSSRICSLLLHCLTLPHFSPKMSVNLWHCFQNQISIQTSSISLLRWFPCEQHLRIHTLNSIEWSTLHSLRHSIICTKFS